MNAGQLQQERHARAVAIAAAGGICAARQTGALPHHINLSVSEALILGLLLQGVQKYIVVLGHGSTEIGEVLRIYQQAGLVQVYAVRSEIEASHAAVALRWVRNEKAAVVASIGPGPLQALAASLTSASNRVGVWYLFGDETSEDEGPNFQQIPRPDQAGFLRLFTQMGAAYTLHTPLALPTALRRGLTTVDHPHNAGPFFLLLPMNVQPLMMEDFNLDELPEGIPPRYGAAADDDNYLQAVDALRSAKRIVVKVGGGARKAGQELLEFLELTDAVAVTAPVVSGIIPYHHPRNMCVGGSKGSICGNFAMEQADLLVAVGTRFVCQSDCSRTGYPNVQCVININTDSHAVTHYGKTIGLMGDAGPTLQKLNKLLQQGGKRSGESGAVWLKECSSRRRDWEDYKAQRYRHPTLFDETWGREVLTQPAAIKVATDWARTNRVVTFFDAGDVQAHGFQIVEDECLGQTFTDGGASYMGFAASAVLASGIATQPFYALAISGDGSFTMNPQILIDGVQHGARGCILILDNRRMSAISALQVAQYGHDFATNDTVEVDYVAWGKAIKGIQALHGGYTTASLLSALETARQYNGLSLIHLPVYYGTHEMGGLGAFGRWNVGNWSEETQRIRHQIGL
ncbi:MAG: thiamine pyrophosphate-binding protein [Anaerolineae bacterium]|nr:thiamine pyrophosphate-binding protein [Anaerolineae bacterium]